MDWTENWNPELGLWSAKGPGHTEPTKNLERVHPGPNAASRLLAAAQVGALGEVDVMRVLAALRAMQVAEPGDRCGCMAWYREEDRPYDTNAAFFTGLSLIVLHRCFYDDLDADARAMLETILSGLHTWFQNAVGHATYFYPNKYLGDLVCGWLLLEILGLAAQDTLVTEHMHKAAAYWRDNGWGWGEHLSDGYTGVCLNELSVLLLLAKDLPDDLRTVYKGLMDELLSIEDAFDGGPRVPALRSYAFLQNRSHTHYRDRVRPWEDGEVSGLSNNPDLGNLLYGLGWHDRVAPRRARRTSIVIPCFNGAVARAHLEDDVRLGSVSRFPVMPSAEYPGWGLSWQSFPVALARSEGDWGFLQWEAREGEVLRAHPALGGPMAHIPKALTDAVSPPVAGRTYALQRESDVLVLRLMPCVPKVWNRLIDRFRLTGAHAEVSESADGAWHQLVLKYPEREISVHCVMLTPGAAVERTPNACDGFDWQAVWTAPELHGRRLIATLWAISLNGPVAQGPALQTGLPDLPAMPGASEEVARELHWVWPNTTWHVRIDPRAQEPLVAL